jgi:hypothetical protein
MIRGYNALEDVGVVPQGNYARSVVVLVKTMNRTTMRTKKRQYGRGRR